MNLLQQHWILVQTLSADALTSTTFIFTLEDTSRYPGYCMNAGDKDDRNFDIIFRETDQSNDSNFTYTVSEDGQTLTVNCTNPATTFTVVVFVRDYGAHSHNKGSILHAVVKMNDKENADGTQKDNTSSNDDDAKNCIAIPRDNNGNDIADSWQDDKTAVFYGRDGFDPWSDDESGPGNNIFHGDGFTVFEEYRGFIKRPRRAYPHGSKEERSLYPFRV